MFPGIVDFVHDDCVFNHFLCFISLRGTTTKKFAKITMISFTKHNEPSNFSYTEGFIMLFERFAYLNHKLHLNIKFYKSHSWEQEKNRQISNILVIFSPKNILYVLSRVVNSYKKFNSSCNECNVSVICHINL